MMKSLLTRLKKSLIALTVIIQTFAPVGFSRVALAEEIAAGETAAAVSPADTCPQVNGTVAPTGAGSHTFTFSPAPTCLWENAYYSWDPVTKVYTPKYDTHVCDAGGVCERINWQYVSSERRYVETRTIVSVPATTAATSTTPTTSSVSPSATTSTGTGNGTTDQTNGSSIVSGNGTDSDNSITDNSNTNADIDLANNASVLTTLNSDATSGDANALFNTTVGDVSTGDATTIANILNMIQSSWDPANGSLTLFSADLFNNYFGDLLFDPSILLGNGTGSTNTIADNSNTDLTINVAENASIENNVNLNAQSGDANANGNTDVGDVSTGDATTVANLINMINSMITSGDSFIGSINLHGDLNGDILLPQSLMDILLGNGTNSTNTISNNKTTDIDASITTSSSITNNTNLTATSGNATADANTTVGNISTGNAETSVNEMNLIGQNIQGTKGLLVFINVMGSWVGMLFNAPVTANIAADNGTNSTNTIANNSTTNADINVERNYSIINNLNLNAASGNATANANTTVGNVSTGNASASVNLLNMIDSKMNFTDWFGVLFINVFGNWKGSFGVNTSAGDNPAPTAGGGGMGGGTPSGTVAAANTDVPEVFRFVARNSRSGQGTGSGPVSGSEQIVAASTASSTSTPSTSPGQTSSTQTEETPAQEAAAEAGRRGNLWLPVSFGIVAIMLMFGERILAFVRRPGA